MARRLKRSQFKRNYNLSAWLIRHAQMAVSSLGRLTRQPASTAMTAFVIGIALALPTGLNLLVNNVTELSASWEGSANISLFLSEDVSDEQAEEISRVIRARSDVAEVELMTRSQALEEFREHSGLGDALTLLDDNPLPAVVLVQPASTHLSSDAADGLAKSLEQYKEIDLAQVDLQWVERLYAISQMFERGISILAFMLAMAVALIIGNTIRLEIQNRHSEIEITRLVGATDSFIRRPFLYEGIWYGFIGAVIALILVILSMLAMSGPVNELVGLYDSGFDVQTLSAGTWLSLLLGGPLLGLSGAWITVNRHLHQIQPE